VPSDRALSNGTLASLLESSPHLKRGPSHPAATPRLPPASPLTSSLLLQPVPILPIEPIERVFASVPAPIDGATRPLDCPGLDRIPSRLHLPQTTQSRASEPTFGFTSSSSPPQWQSVVRSYSSALFIPILTAHSPVSVSASCISAEHYFHL
jgi:hypothetical protein